VNYQDETEWSRAMLLDKLEDAAVGSEKGYGEADVIGEAVRAELNRRWDAAEAKVTKLSERVTEMHQTIATTSRNFGAETARADAAEARVRELEAEKADAVQACASLRGQREDLRDAINTLRAERMALWKAATALLDALPRCHHSNKAHWRETHEAHETFRECDWAEPAAALRKAVGR